MLRQLTRTGDMNTRAVFSPNSRYLAFVRGYRPCRLVVLNVETDEETIVAEDTESIRPVWRKIPAPQK